MRKVEKKLKNKVKKVEKKSFKKIEKFQFFSTFFFSPHHPDQMSGASQVSKITIHVKIRKWHSVSHSVTKGRYRAARAAKNIAALIVG